MINEMKKIKDDFEKEHQRYISKLVSITTSIRAFTFVQDTRMDIVITHIDDEFILQQLNPRFDFPQVPIYYYGRVLASFYEKELEGVEPTNVDIIQHITGGIEIKSNDNIIAKYDGRQWDNKFMIRLNKHEAKGLANYIKDNKWFEEDFNLLQIEELDIRKVLY